MSRLRTTQRREAQFRGQIEVNKPIMAAFCAIHERFAGMMKSWDYRSASEDYIVNIPVRRFTLKELKDLAGVMRRAKPSPRSMITSLEQHIDAIENPSRNISSLVLLETALKAYLKKDILMGWVYFKIEAKNEGEEGILVPALIHSIDYYPTVKHDGWVTPAHTDLEAIFWCKGKKQRRTFDWHTVDLGSPIEELFLRQGLIKETKALNESYITDEAQFLEWRKMLGEQFVGNGRFMPNSERWWDKERDADMNNTKLIVNDRCDNVEKFSQSSLFAEYLEERDDEVETSEEGRKLVEKYNRLPIHYYIWMFNLSSHREGYVHMNSLEPYKYRPELREKLVLSDEHAHLIDALTTNTELLQEDIVLGKTGGTTIICQGPAGTGKTLTAEIYSEVMKRPLYRVHSGQLGIEATGVEEELNQALDRAMKWDAVLLIDEADVFLMKRGANLELNAVVGVFLRVLEYYSGVLFLTTNRQDDIDDAILSRCIARITYSLPQFAERVQLWRTLGDVYGMGLIRKKGVVDKLATRFDKASGRDIKGLIRLVMRYAKNQDRTPEFEDFEKLSAFRGM